MRPVLPLVWGSLRLAPIREKRVQSLVKLILAFSNNLQFELRSLDTLLLHSPAPLRLVNGGSKLRTKPKIHTERYCARRPTVAIPGRFFVGTENLRVVNVLILH